MRRRRPECKTEVFAEETAAHFRQMTRDLNIANDDFIRTTEPRHHRAAQEIWRRVAANGDIYKGDYEGWYCTVDEVFVPETQLADGKCPTCGRQGRAAEGGELLLPPLEVSAAAARLLRGQSRFPAAGVPTERGADLRRGRSPGSEHQPDVVPLGRSGPRRSRARHVRLVRRVDELPDRPRLRLR